MSTYVTTTTEDGLESPIGTWTGDATPANLNSTNRIGLRFVGMPVDSFPTVSRTQAASVLKDVSLVLRAVSANQGVITVHYVDELDPAAFGASPNLPSQRTTVEVGSTAFVSAVQVHVTIPLDLERITFRQRSLNWNGRLAFVVTWSLATNLVVVMSEAANSANHPRLETEELNYVTGVARYGDAHSRIDRCPRCGRLQPRELFVKDGFVRNLLVCTRCYDEPDLVHKTGIRPGRERPGINN